MPLDGSGNYQYPLGTRGVPDETIESAAYNNFLDDLVGNDLNIPRPVHRGGTGATTADAALFNLGAEKAAQLVTNYDTHLWLPGSFRSAGSATGGPVAGHAFAGIVYINEPLASPPTNANVTVSARDMDDTVVPSRVYVRDKKVNVWGPWTVVDATTLPFPPGGGIAADTILEAIQELDAEKASIDYVNSVFATVGTAPFDAIAYNGMQVNGGMEVNQGGAASVTLVNSGAFEYAADGIGGKWTAASGGAAVGYDPMASVLPLPGFSNCVYMRCTTINATLAAGHQQWLTMPIEGYRVSRLAYGSASARPITISFWVMPDNAGTMALAIQNSASDRSYVVDVPALTAGTWQYRTVTIPGDVAGAWQTGSGIGLKVHFCFGAGTTFRTTPNAWTAGNFAATATTTNWFAATGRISITGVTVIPGSSGPSAAQSSLLVRPYDEEFARCQRYYQRQASTTSGTILATGQAYNTTTGIFYIRFPVQMRASPALVLSHTASTYLINGAATTGAPASAIVTSVGDNTGVASRIEATTSALVAGQALLMQTNTPGASLAFNARLAP